mgnify:FL=1
MLYHINLLVKLIRIKRKKGKNKTRLEDLLSFQKRLVEEKGLPPSKLMLEQAALASSQLVEAEPVV